MASATLPEPVWPEVTDVEFKVMLCLPREAASVPVSRQLTGNGRQGTTVHFEKDLDWVPGAAGEHL